MISIKLLRSFIEITLRYGYSPVNLLHIFTTSFLKNTSERLLLNDQGGSFLKSENLIFFGKYHSTDFCLSVLNDKILKSWQWYDDFHDTDCYVKGLSIQSIMIFFCKYWMLLVSLYIHEISVNLISQRAIFWLIWGKMFISLHAYSSVYHNDLFLVLFSFGYIYYYKVMIKLNLYFLPLNLKLRRSKISIKCGIYYSNKIRKLNIQDAC